VHIHVSNFKVGCKTSEMVLMRTFLSYFCCRVAGFADQTDITEFRQILIKTKLYVQEPGRINH